MALIGRRSRRAVFLTAVTTSALSSAITFTLTVHLWSFSAAPPAPPADIQQDTTRGVDERWTRRLVLDDRQLREGMVLRGNQARARRFMQKLLNGEAVSVGWVGGSVATGVGSSDRSRTAFGPQFFQWINDTFPHPDHRWKNGGVDGTTSSYMALCLSQHVDRDVDVVLVEYALNDFQDAGQALGNWDNHTRRAVERLLRKLLQYPRRPALIMLGAFPHRWYDPGQPHQRLQEFYRTAEDEQGVLAQYYSLPWVSFRDATWRSLRQNVSGFSMDEIMALPRNDHHPNDRGHLIMADLAVGMLQSVAEEMTRRPLDGWDEAIANEALLAPMLKDNDVFVDVEYCLMREKFKDVVTATDRFEWVNEAKEGRDPKLGFVGTEVGASLEFRFDSSATTSAGEKVPLRLSYLASYEHMGRARIECVHSCECDPSEFNGLWEHKQSQLQGHGFAVTRAPECTVRVSILEESGGDGHKVKVAGVAVSDEAGFQGGFLNQIDWKPPA